MERYWWTVWIKVAVLAVALIFAFRFGKGIVMDLFEPYLVEESAAEEVDSEDSDLVAKIMGKVEDLFNVQLDYENMIFDYANEYAQTMMEQSVEERRFTEAPED